MWQTVHVFDGAQDIVVIDGFSVLSGLHHGADKDRRDVIGGYELALVPLHDQKAIVVSGPCYVSQQMCL